MNSGNSGDPEKKIVPYDIEGTPIGQKISFWDILPILVIVGGFVTVMVLYFWALESAVSGG
jgi:hypothetical protein